MAANECILRSKNYEEMQVTPVAAAVVGEVVQFNGVLAFYITAFTAAMLAATEEASVIYRAAKVQVIKAAGVAWAPGEPIYWDAANSQFVNVDTGALVLCGFALEVAASAAVTGFITFIGDAELIGGGLGLKIKQGVAAVTGTLADVDTGLTIITRAFATIQSTTQGAGEAAYVTLDHGADGLLDFYAWDDAGAAATVATNVNWLAIGV
jgi:predicted RecA/RadA family phage recombinase